MTITLDPATALLRQICVINLDPYQHALIIQRAEAITDWNDLIQQAEVHGLSNLTYYHLTKLGFTIPDSARHQFLALKARHRRANLARHHGLEEILQIFSEHGIESAVLKGAALVHLIYPDPELRPMSDIDILVKSDNADQAQQLLREIGYRADARQTGYLAEHHHLPVASKTENGISLHVEIHHDALSGDVKSSIKLDSLQGPLQPFKVGDHTAYALGHTDMLRHLCHHTIEPIENIKLGAIADLYGYMCKNFDHLDKDEIENKFPFVLNLFILLHYLSPLPPLLQQWIKPSDAPAPSGVGKGFVPMSKTMAKYKNPVRQLVHLLDAPDWWLYGFYNIKPENTIVWTRWISHPLQIGRWIYRRIKARSNA